MKNLITELKQLIAEEDPIFAGAEEALYFRKKWAAAFQAPDPKPLPTAPEPPILTRPKVATPLPLVPAIVETAAPEPMSFTPIKPVLTSFEEIQRIVAKVAPELRVIHELPDDELAKKMANRWKTKNQAAPISVLSLHEPKEQRALLEQITLALDVYFGPAQLIEAEKIEKEQQWQTFLSVEGLKLIVSCDYTLWQLNHLMKFYKETPAQNARMLGPVAVLLLPDLSLYLKDAGLKRSLWKALCQKLSS